jgi:ribosomal protein S27AE
LQSLKNACPVRTVRRDDGVSVGSLCTRVTGAGTSPYPNISWAWNPAGARQRRLQLISCLIPPLAIGSSPATPPSVAPQRLIAAPAPSARREHAHRQLREGRRHGIPIGINQARVWAAEEALQRLGRFCLRHRACAQHLHRAQHSSPPIPRWACGYCGDRQKCGWAHLNGRRAELTRGQRRRRVGGREV